MNEELPDPSASDPERIRRELEAETARELAKAATTERKRGEERKVTKRPIDSDADTVLPSQTIPIGGTSVYRMLHPASPISAGVVSAIMGALSLVAGSGIGMALAYVPTAERAHASAGALQDNWLGAMLRGIHYHGTNVLIYLCMMYLVHLLWSGFFRRPGQMIWWRALTLMILVLAFAFTGQLLPFDQLALHGTSIRLSYVGDVPLIGEGLRGFMTGGSEVGTSTVARFYALHAIILPALGAILLRRFWRDGRAALNSKTSLSLHAMLVAAVGALVLFMASISSAPLGLSGNLGEPFKEARPEWYALPLYQLLKWAHPGALGVVVLVGMPLVAGAGLFVLPWLESVSASQQRFKWPVRGVVVASLTIAIVLGVWPVFEDMSAENGRGAGYFARDDANELMMKLKRRNEALGHNRSDLPEDTPTQARDLMQLAELLRKPLRVTEKGEREKFPERAALVDYHMDTDGKVDEIRRKEWNKWVEELAKAARELYEATDATPLRAARERLRAACQNCHDDYDVFEPLNPKPRGYIEAPPRVEPPKDLPKDPPKDPPRDEPFFLESKFSGLTADIAPAKPKDLMRRSRSRIAELMQIAGLYKGEKPPMRMGEQIILDLQSYAKATPAMYAEFKDFTSETEWKKAAQAGEAALKELLKANKGEDFKKKLEAYGQTCDDCHKLVEEDFRFADIVKPK
jgi:quinol-cytochrome oxidoreductase complex cytochrome b subunit